MKKTFSSTVKLIGGIMCLFIFMSVIHGCASSNAIHGNISAAFNGTSTEQSSPTISETIEGASLDSASTFSVKYVDVGQADCELIECDGHWMLIDGGNAADSQTVYSVLSSEGVTTLDAVIATHMHEDHIGGLPAAFEKADVKAFYGDGSVDNTKVYRSLVNSAYREGISETVPTVGQSFMLGSAKVEFLHTGHQYSDENENSLVVKITYGATSFLFEGDASQQAEKDMLSSGVDLSADVLKVGHHGSDTATGYAFLRSVMPSTSVIEVGTGNKYGHPTETTLSKLRDEGCAVYRTDLNGDIVISSDGTSISAITCKQATQETEISQAG